MDVYRVKFGIHFRRRIVVCRPKRQVIILIPCILILSTIFGLDGIFMAVPIADFSAFVITIVLLSCSLKKEIKMS